MSKPPSGRVGRVRADLALVEQGLAGDRPVSKAGEEVPEDVVLRLRSQQLPYVSRGGLKLAHALATFALDVKGAVAVDVGASTGGFTDCLLQNGAARVYCVDVGHGQLDWKIASDPRVVVVDRTNARHLTREQVPELCDLAVVDVSFISVRLVLPALLQLLRPGAALVVLVKPQFEVGRGRVGKGGIVRDEQARSEAVAAVAEAARQLGLEVRGETPSPITGQKGNVEFLLYLRARS